MGDALSFPNAVEELVEAVGHDEMHSDEIVDRSEAANRDIALEVWQAKVSLHHAGWGFLVRWGTAHWHMFSYLVLDGLIAPNWGHILRHCDGWSVNN